MKFLASLAWGVVLGTAAVFLHSAYMPAGLLLALVGSGVGVWLVGKGWGRRSLKIACALGWLLIVLRAASLGVGSELLVQGNGSGNALVVGGLITIIFAVALRAS